MEISEIPLTLYLKVLFNITTMQKEQLEHIEALHDIRTMMRKSSRFLSLSGLSGIFAGIYALGGYFTAMWYVNNQLNGLRASLYMRNSPESSLEVYGFFILLAAAVLGLSLLTAYYFSSRKAKKNNVKLLDHTAWRLIWQMTVPLLTGGILSFALLLHMHLAFIAPTMLCFYGAALFAASNITYDNVKYLGIAQIALGIISAFDLGNGLFYWAIGFGVLHIIYGVVMWWKYERGNS